MPPAPSFFSMRYWPITSRPTRGSEAGSVTLTAESIFVSSWLVAAEASTGSALTVPMLNPSAGRQRADRGTDLGCADRLQLHSDGCQTACVCATYASMQTEPRACTNNATEKSAAVADAMRGLEGNEPMVELYRRG